MQSVRPKQFYELGFNDLDEYGFERPSNFNCEEYERFTASYVPVVTLRSQKWTALLIRQNGVKRSRKLKRYIRLGVPILFRSLVWLEISGAENLKSKVSDDFYASLIKQEHNCPTSDTVLLDLHRTYPDNIFFQSSGPLRSKLHNILVAYAHHNPKIGYCQGLNYIAGMLLLATKSEETTFWLLKVLVENILEGYYSSTMEGVIVDVEVLSELIRTMVPDVYEHISNLGLPLPILTTKWFVCLYADILPVETVFRVWDCLFSEGSKILFRVGITLIKSNRTQLLACEDFTDVAEYFKNMTKNNLALFCHDFMESIFHVPGKLSNSTIRKLRKKIQKERRAQIEEIKNQT